MALGSATFSAAGGAVSDLFAGFGYGYKAKGAKFEQENYDLAAGLADQNAQFAAMSRQIKEQQQERTNYQTIGGIQSDVAGAGFQASGSALDILRDSASQGALTKAVVTEQGLIQEAGYKEQAQSYRNMSQAAQVAIDAAKTAEIGSYISAGIKGAAAIGSLFTGGIGGGDGGGAGDAAKAAFAGG